MLMLTSLVRTGLHTGDMRGGHGSAFAINNALLPSDIIDLETVLLDVMGP